MSALTKLKISSKLSSVIGAALIALCVMGGIAIFATGKIQDLGHDLYSENKQFLGMEMSVSIGIERAIADVHSPPSQSNPTRLSKCGALGASSRRPSSPCATAGPRDAQSS